MKFHRTRFLSWVLLVGAQLGWSGWAFAEVSVFPKKRRIPLGETVRIQLPGVKRLRLSREGVLIARPGKGDDWMLTGTARGVVLVHPESSDTGSPAEAGDIVAEVFTAPVRTASAHPAATRSELPECDGLMASTGAFDFQVSMNSRRKAREAGLPLHVEANAQWLNATGKGVSAGSRLGFGISGADMAASVDSKVLANPRLVMFPGSEAIARSGGEFRVEAPVLQYGGGNPPTSGGNPNGLFPGRIDVWKEYGLALKAKWVGCVRDAAVIEYEVAVTQRISGSEQHLLAGRISGKRLVEPGIRHFGGAVEFASGAKSIQGSWILERIPLLGPLFARRGDEDGDATMSLWIQSGSEFESGSYRNDGASEGGGA